MAKTVVGVMDDFSEAQATVRDLAAAGLRGEDINVVAKEGGEAVVTATVASEDMAARAEQILRQRRQVTAQNQAALNERVYYAEERAAARSPEVRYEGPDRRSATAPHSGNERRRMI